jgi:large subunit ribosomal protein L18
LSTKKIEKVRVKRKKRVSPKVSGTMTRPRLAVFRSARHIYVQAVADDVGRTLTEASTLSPDLQDDLKGKKKADKAKLVGALLSKKLKALGIEEAVFDRGRFLYHGRVKSLADAAREGGLKF